MKLLISLWLILLLVGCRTDSSSISSGIVDETITIVDINNREWDITHAVNNYGMIEDHFQFGVGYGTIASIDNPLILEKEDPNFPGTDTSFAIFGTGIMGEKRAYSREQLTKHEILNDVFFQRPARYLAIAHCPLYNLAAVYERRLDGKLLTFAASGWTYGEFVSTSLFVLVDKETQSLWFPMELNGSHGLVCISGVYQDKFLPEVQQLARAGWTDWLASNPATKFVTSQQ